MTHGWIFRSVCYVRRHCTLQAGCKEGAEKLLSIFLKKRVAVLKREVVIFYLSLTIVTWLHHYEVSLKSVGRSSHYSNTHYTDSPYSCFHSSLCPTKGSTLQWCTKHRACTFPCKSHKCIDSSRFFSCVFLCMFKTQFRLPVYSVKVLWGCLEKCWIHFLYICDTKATKLFESVRLVTCLAWPDKKHLPIGNLAGNKSNTKLLPFR